MLPRPGKKGPPAAFVAASRRGRDGDHSRPTRKSPLSQRGPSHGSAPRRSAGWLREDLAPRVSAATPPATRPGCPPSQNLQVSKSPCELSSPRALQAHRSHVPFRPVTTAMTEHPRKFPAQALGSKKSVGGGDTFAEKGGTEVPRG